MLLAFKTPKGSCGAIYVRDTSIWSLGMLIGQRRMLIGQHEQIAQGTAEGLG